MSFRRAGARLFKRHRPNNYERYSWVEAGLLPEGRGIHLRGNSWLAPLPDGTAILYWTFDELEDGSTASLILNVTDEEAQAIFDTPMAEGMIEAIRATLADPWGLILRANGDSVVVRMFRVPSDTDEYEFVAELDLAAQNAPEWYAHIRGMMEVTLTDLRTELEEAKQTFESARVSVLLSQIATTKRQQDFLVKSTRLLVSA